MPKPKNKTSQTRNRETWLSLPLKNDAGAIVTTLKSLGSRKTRDEMSTRYGIHLPDPNKAFGVGMAAMQKVTKGAKGKDAARNHELAAALWESGWYEARMVACMVDEPKLVTSTQMDCWCKDFDNWGICDTVCFKLFDQVPRALDKVEKWARLKGEFQKRAAFALLACIALHDKKADDDEFAPYLPVVEHAASDERNFVKKGVSWSLRAMAMRGQSLKQAVLGVAQRLAESDDATQRWVGKDVLRQIKKSASDHLPTIVLNPP